MFVGCSPIPTATIPPSPQAVQVAYQTSLAPVEDALIICAHENPQMALILNTRQERSDFSSSDVTIWWGEKPLEASAAYPIASDDLVVIIHGDNPVEEISTNELAALFSGQIENWSAVNDYQQPVSVWTYPEGNHFRSILRSAFLGEGEFSLLSHLAPTPHEMLTAVGENPGAVGFIPRSWLSSEVVVLNLETGNEDLQNFPILALTAGKPQGVILAFIECLQSGAGQAELMEKYSPLGSGN